VITVIGTGVERFINLSFAKGIRLWDIFRLPNNTVVMKVLPAGFFQLRETARITRCRVRIKKKHGLPFVMHQLKGRPLLVIGAIFFLIALIYLSSFIWYIEVAPLQPLQHVSQIEIMEKAKEKGLFVGSVRRQLDLSLVEKYLERSIPELAWVGIQLEGTRARIQVAERLLPPFEYQHQELAHVVAAKDGVIKEILVMIGEPMVTVGDTVLKGQVLISGIINHQGRIEHRRARGIVRARVWYEAEEIAFLTKRLEKPTGRKSIALSLLIGNQEIVLKRAGGQFANARPSAEVVSLLGRNFPVPVELITITYHEVEISENTFTPAEALAAAEARALAHIESQMPAGVAIVNQSVNLLAQDKGRLAVKVTAEAVIDIGVLKPVTP
jgi:similar to stage IV sporulation protein